MKSALMVLSILMLSGSAWSFEVGNPILSLDPAKIETSSATSSAQPVESVTAPRSEAPRAPDAESVATQDPSATKDNSSYVICRSDSKQVRTIRVDLKGSTCKTVYTKEGKDDIVGRSAAVDLCYEVVNKIRVNLEKHGSWKCKDVQPDRVSFTTE